MAFLLYEGFEGLVSPTELPYFCEVLTEAPSSQMVPGGAVGNAYSVNASSGDAKLRYDISSVGVGPTFITGFRLRLTEVSSVAGTVQFRVDFNDGANDSAWLEVRSIGPADRWNIYLGYGSTTIATASALVQANDYAYIEWKTTLNNTTGGSFEVKVDEVTISSNSGITTSQGNPSSINHIDFTFTGGVGSVELDDIYLYDDTTSDQNDFEGDIVIFGLSPNEDISTGWTPNVAGADNYTMVDDPTVDEDVTYVQAATSGAKDLYGFEDLPASIVASIVAVELRMIGRLVTAGSGTVRQVTKSGTTEGFVSETLSKQGYRGFKSRFFTNPDTGVAWTQSEINSMQAGIEIP